MTGFGVAEAKLDDLLVSVEVKSLNSRNLDLALKLPSGLRQAEQTVRNLISDHLQRGKIALSIKVDGNGNDASLYINKKAFKSIVKQIGSLADELDLDKSDLLGIAIRLPEIWDADPEEENENHDWDQVEPVFLEALSKMNQYRSSEGTKLEKDLLERVAMIEDLLEQMTKFEKGRVEQVKEKLMSRLSEMNTVEGVDQNRLEQELIYYLEKMDITEEKVRLSAHCKYFAETTHSDFLVKGKKLGFIAQEMGREINTIGSKANNLDIQQLVVQMKDELEKIKEQVMNVL